MEITQYIFILLFYAVIRYFDRSQTRDSYKNNQAITAFDVELRKHAITNETAQIRERTTQEFLHREDGLDTV